MLERDRARETENEGREREGGGQGEREGKAFRRAHAQVVSLRGQRLAAYELSLSLEFSAVQPFTATTTRT
eukprot:6186778-Pleurochrysis_carterae.AAC.1